ncbi:hypothetical protein NSQ54_05205 [Alkalihalobacillus sp. FSL W8-0930]
MAKKIFYLTSVLFIITSGVAIYAYNTCNNVFQSKLLNAGFSSMVVHSDQGEMIVSDADEIDSFIEKVNQCPRSETDEMSFEDSGLPIILELEESHSTEELYYLHTDNMHLLYKGYVIKTDMSLEELLSN